MDESFRIGLLYQVYGSFLTQNQQSLMHAYFYEDLSLQEIGNNLGISKQAVSSQLQRAVHKIDLMEKRLKVMKKNMIADQELGDLIHAMEQTLSSDEKDRKDAVLFKELDELKSIRQKLVGEESDEEYV